MSIKLQKPLFLIAIVSLLLAFAVLLVIQKQNPLPNKGNDIYHIWSDGYEIAHGSNPYSKIHGSDMLRNNKYSTYLPGFFLLVSAYVSLGNETFQDWIDFWRPATYILHCLLGCLIFCVLLARSNIFLALFGTHFWLLSRWPISVMGSGQIDILAIIVLLLALLAVNSKPRTALILFGLSLSIKQIGIFMLPVFLALNYRLDKNVLYNFRSLIVDLLYIAIIPVVVCLPFLFWDPTGLVKSILFSATRSPGGHIKVPSLDELIGVVGIIAKIPMILMMCLVYILVLLKRLPVFTAALAIYLVFISFNSVIFKQYMPWFCAFLGLALAELEFTDSKKKNTIN